MADPEVYALSDRELIASAVRVEASPLFRDHHLRLSKWERDFLKDLPEFYRVHASITWGQRRSMRRLLEKITEQLRARQDVAELRAEAQLLLGGR
jgi:hypothetical protein